MELAYIWVEKYKNIEKKGFNFDKDVEFILNEKESKLDLKKRDNPLNENFWGSQISNILLIVGENGKGKSNLLRLIISVYKNTVQDEVYKDNKTSLFCIFKTPQNNYILKKYNDLVSYQFVEPTIINLDTDDSNFTSIGKVIIYDNIFNPLSKPDDDLNSRTNDIYNISTFSLIDRDNEIRTESAPNRNYLRESYGNVIRNYEQRNIERQIEGFSEFTDNEIPFTVPNILQIKVNSYHNSWLIHNESKHTYFKKLLNLKFDEESIVGQSLSQSEIINRWLMPFYKNALYNFFIYHFHIVQNPPLEQFEKKIEGTSVLDIINTFFEIEIITLEKIELFFKSLIKIDQEFFNQANSILLFFIDLRDYFENKNAGIDIIRKENLMKIYVNFNSKDKYLPFANLSFDDYSTKSLKSLLTNYFRSIEFNGYLDFDWKMAISGGTVSLSSGQLTLLNLFSRLHSVYKEFKNDINFNSDVIILMDEPDVTLHPEWQRVFISSLVNFLENKFSLGNKIQIIITTHSPILVSDFPKSNVIYLAKDNSVPNNETFGANILTLLSHSFFMDKSLIGEFSRNKIEQILIKLIGAINKKKDSIRFVKKHQSEIESFIKQIGDDVVKTKLLQMFYLVTEENPTIALRKFYENKIKELND